MAEKYRRRPNENVALRNPETGIPTVPHPDELFDRDHPLVKAYPWAFATEAEIAAQREADANVTAVRISDAQPVETTEATPGQVTRRTRRTDRA